MISRPQYRIAIVGAGIGGMTLSNALGVMDNGDNLQVDIYEAASHISEFGAGINLWPRAWEILKNVGLEPFLLKILPEDLPKAAFHFRKSDQPQGFPIKDLSIKGSVKFHRSDLQRALMTKMAGNLHLSHRLVSYEELDDEVRLNFQDGSSATCDLLIAMDGIKSTIRKQFLRTPAFFPSPSADPVWGGGYAYRGLISAEALESLYPGHPAVKMSMMYMGKHKSVVVYPVSQNQIVNVVAFKTELASEGMPYNGPSFVPCSQAEVLDAFHGWEEQVLALLKCLENPTKWRVLSLVPLESYASGRIILAGDAAHAMEPHQGAGAGQAIEDAYILAALISKAAECRIPVQAISEAYDVVCCPAGNKVIERSRTSGMLYQLDAPGFERVAEGDTTVPYSKLLSLTKQLQKDWSWVAESAETDRERALKLLENYQ